MGLNIFGYPLSTCIYMTCILTYIIDLTLSRVFQTQITNQKSRNDIGRFQKEPKIDFLVNLRKERRNKLKHHNQRRETTTAPNEQSPQKINIYPKQLLSTTVSATTGNSCRPFDPPMLFGQNRYVRSL